MNVEEGERLTIHFLSTKEQIRLLRRGLRITQQELGDILGVNKLCVARWEVGTRECKGSSLFLMNILTNYCLWEKEIERLGIKPKKDINFE